jgi:SAM-dependent methyltransferase
MVPNPKYSLLDDDDDEVAAALGLLLPEEVEEGKALGQVRTENWRDHPDITTNSLWLIGSRSREGTHQGDYHGNFVPQIPYQILRRFTQPGDVVVDPFLGSGTTLIECRRQGRHGLGIELNPILAQETQQRIAAEANPHQTWQQVIAGDSTAEEVIAQARQTLADHGTHQAQLLLMHPPYHDIIRFSDDPRDLANAPTLDNFLEAFQRVVRNTYDLLQTDHFLVVVIGDKYGQGEWIPLGFYTLEAVRAVGYKLKSIVVKNIAGNRAKRNLHNFWRQRAFRGHYYIFKHEYIFFFQKRPAGRTTKKPK